MKPSASVITLAGAFLFLFVLLAPIHPWAQETREERGGEQGDNDDDDQDSRVAIGLRIAPVRLSFDRRDRQAVGWGSYLVNAVGGCNDCHTCPPYEPGHNPYRGGDGRINSLNYLAGGRVFDPPGVTSANITPDVGSGDPGDLTFAEFKSLIRTGHDPDEPDRILQVMPWPIYRNMSDGELRAIYAFLRAIPHAEPGRCAAPGP